MAKLQEEFIRRLFAARDAAHRAHWTTDSGYVHETLGGFYEGVPGEVDKFIEAHIAATGESVDAGLIQAIERAIGIKE